MRGVTCSAPNCTVSLIATSNEMMRPVILSRPANTAVGLVIFCPGVSVTTSSPGCSPVLACCGRGWRWPDGAPAGDGESRVPGSGGGGRVSGSACTPPGGGGNGWPRTPVRADGGGPGGSSPVSWPWTGGRLGTVDGGRGGGSPKIEPNCATAGEVAAP